MTNIQKVILLVGAINAYKRPDTLKVRDGKLYRATWDDDYHNGDIDNYKEALTTEVEAERHVCNLERIYAEQQWESYVELEKKNFVKNLYAMSPKLNDLKEK
jgi:hypothetical protein